MRSQEELLSDIANMLGRQIGLLEHISMTLGASGSVSSVELTVDSKAIVKPTVKIYDLDGAAACEQAQTLFDDLIIKYGGTKS